MISFKEKISSSYKKTWFFPLLLLVFVAALSILQINGSSMGVYHAMFYGDTQRDSNLLANNPRAIRSDEWLVTTQLSLGQVKSGFHEVNDNIGEGENLSLLTDTPNLSFLQLFKPQNIGYFFLPEGVAFSLKWWLPVYFLIIAVYFFILTLMPKKKVLAIITALAFTASPFLVWWNQYSILCTILFMLVASIKMFHSQSIKKGFLWAILLAYLTTSFIVTLYPPFLIATGLVAIAFLVGYYFDHRPKTWAEHKSLIFGSISAITLTSIFTLLSLIPNAAVIETTANTAYPGARIVQSGDFNPSLFMASNVSALMQDDVRSSHYGWILNQSEGSNFLLVFLLLVPLLIYFLFRYRSKISNFYTSLCVLAIGLLFTAWMFIPNIDWLGHIFLLHLVPQPRLLIGFGLINLLILILFLQMYDGKKIALPKYAPLIYSIVILIFYTWLNLRIHSLFPLFMGTKWALLLALPYPIMIYLILKKKTLLGISALLLFSFASVYAIHPLYRGVDTLSESKISKTIREIDTENSKKWTTDTFLLENMPIMNGKKSLSGTYVYPQNNLWEKNFPRSDYAKHNRYAHVHFVFDRDANKTIKPSLDQPAPDQLSPSIEPCDNFLKSQNVGFIMTTTPFTKDNARCATLVKTVDYPLIDVYFYTLSF